MRKNEKGITLIALIITVIVLIILAAISISAIGGNGIVGKAKKAKSNTESSGKKEESGIDDLYNEIELGESGYIEGEDTREEFYLGEKVENPKNKINNYPTYLANIEEAQRLISLIKAETSKLSEYGAMKNRLEHTVINLNNSGNLQVGSAQYITLHRYSTGEDVKIDVTNQNSIEEAYRIMEEESEIIVNNFEYNGYKILKNGAIAHVVYGDYGQRELTINFRRASLDIASADAAGMGIYSSGGLARYNLEIAKYFVSGVCEILDQESNYSKDEIEVMIGKKGTETIRKYLSYCMLAPMLGNDAEAEGVEGLKVQMGANVNDPLGDELFTEETGAKVATMSKEELMEAIDEYFNNLLQSDSNYNKANVKSAIFNYYDGKELFKVALSELDRIAKEAHYYQTEKKMLDGTYGKDIPSLKIKDLGLTGKEDLLPKSAREASITRVRNAIAILDETLNKFDNL